MQPTDRQGSGFASNRISPVYDPPWREAQPHVQAGANHLKRKARRRHSQAKTATGRPTEFRLRRFVLLALSASFPPLSLRVALHAGRALAPALTDLRGVLSDLLIASLVTVALVALARRARVAALVVAELWALACWANFEHVRALGANATLDYATYLTDATFLRGSVLSVSSPFALVLLILAVGVSTWFAARQPDGRWPRAVLAATFAVLAVIQFVWPVRLDVLGWRQTNFVSDAVGGIFRRNRDHGVQGGITTQTGDLSGEPLVPLGRGRQNVLLIIVESVSGGHIGPIATTNGWNSDFPTTQLARLALRGLTYTNFITQQRQTNRGEYSLLCGDYDRLGRGVAKMSQYAQGPPRPCLPWALGRAGYETVYLQAAPLAFMMKDQFMPRAGFARVLGEPWFEYSYGENKWGIDDRAFYEQSMRMVDELRGGRKPWMLTLLTVGTHHPYNVPASYPGRPGNSRFERAEEYADAAVGSFVQGLEAKGVLDDTLVLIASDESEGLERGASDFRLTLSQNWGLLLALVPGGSPRFVEEPFMQMDLPLSVLDYLGIPEGTKRFPGRSVFRHYRTGRSLAFANTYKHLVGGQNADGTLFVCDDGFTRCTKTATLGGRTFTAENPQTVDPRSEELDFLRAIAKESLATADFNRARHIDLIPKQSPLPLPAQTTYDKIVIGGQMLYVPPRTLIEVDLACELRGPALSTTDLAHDLYNPPNQPVFRRSFRLRGGDRLELRYSYRTGNQELDPVEYRLWARNTAGPGLTLVIQRASMTLAPDPKGPETPALEISTLKAGSDTEVD